MSILSIKIEGLNDLLQIAVNLTILYGIIKTILKPKLMNSNRDQMLGNVPDINDL